MKKKRLRIQKTEIMKNVINSTMVLENIWEDFLEEVISKLGF